MTLKDWNNQVTMLKDLRSKFDRNFATAKNEGVNGMSVFLDKEELWLLAEVCAQRQTDLNSGHFEYKGYK
jgi:hypothetical protein